MQKKQAASGAGQPGAAMPDFASALAGMTSGGGAKRD